MEKENDKSERRRQLRTTIPRSLGCIIATGSNFRAGLLADISRSGLSFSYIDQGHPRITTGTLCKLSLFDYDKRLVMKDVSAKIVYDCIVNEENCFLPKKRIGMEFKELPLTSRPGTSSFRPKLRLH
jgi:hypothetical protein